MTALKLGKHDPVQSDINKSLKFSDYLPAVLPIRPSCFDNLSNVYSSLGVSDPTVLFPMDGNDKYGDCVLASWSHAVTVYNGLIGKQVIHSGDDVIQQYLKLTGGQDTGLNMQSTIDYAVKNGLLGEKPPVFVYVDPTHIEHVKLAIYLFGGLMTGIQVDDKMQDQFIQRVPWDGSGTQILGGHGIFTVAYDGVFTNLTWGNTVGITPNCWINRVDECWCILSSEEFTNTAKFLDSGFDIQQLQDDLQAIQDQY